MDNYGTRLKKILIIKGIKQVHLAEGVGSNPKNINSYLSGRAEPPLDMVNKIACFLDVPLDYFMGNISIEDVLNDKSPSAVRMLKGHFSDDVYQIIEIAAMLRNEEILELFRLIQMLETESISEILKFARKEYFIQTHKK